MENINWYPGHMKKTKELIKENLKLVNAVIEVLDARLPISSSNPVIDELVKNKIRIVLLNKYDLSDSEITERWIQAYRKKGITAIPMNSVNGDGLKQLIHILDMLNERINDKGGRVRPLRVMIVGIPNVGKSSLINRFAGKRSARIGNKPGVTRGKQWISIKGNIQLLDTPGILWPKFEDQQIAVRLAFVGSIKDEILDIEDIAFKFVEFLQKNYPDLLKERYKLEILKETPLEIMDDICIKRGFIRSGGKNDYERVSKTIIDEYRNGKIGKISIEKPDI